MGATYTRQSSYADGDTITSAHTNDEFNQLLAAFAINTGHTHDGTTAEGGPITKLLGTAITIGNGTAGTDITITYDGETNDGVMKWMEDEDYFEFSDDILIATTEKLQFRDTAIYINSSADGQLDLVADTEIQIAATTIDMNGAVDISGNLGVGGNLVVTGTTTFNGGTITMGDAASDNVVFGADINSSIIPNTDDTFDLGSAGQQWRNLFLDGTANIDVASIDSATIDSATITSIAADTTLATDKKILFRDTGLFINSSADGQLDIVADTEIQIAATTVDINGAVDVSGNLVVGGDLTISGDDLVMGTNTAGALLIADGTNFNPTVITDLSEIGTAASGDILLAIDASGGGLKKITRSTLTAGLASDSAISNVVEDTSPQLGGNLDTNSQNILIDDAHFIGDENGNEQIIFQTTGSAVNQFDITNSASSTAFLQGPILQATGGDSNIDLNLIAKGTGVIAVRGNSASGAVQFNCESNSHGQIVQGQPHSAGVTNTMLLPAGANSTLVSLVSADTLTNKTLTTPTLTGTSIVASLDISGDIDVDGTTNLDVVDIDGAVNMATTATITGNLTLGAQLIMPDVTSTKILVADGTSFQEVAISGDVTIANTGAVTIAATSVEGSMLNNNVISGQTALTSGLATTDELLVSDGGTLKRMDVSVLTALTDASAADSAVALAIALG